MGIFSGLLTPKPGSGYLLNPQTQNQITSFDFENLVAATFISVKLSGIAGVYCASDHHPGIIYVDSDFVESLLAMGYTQLVMT